MGVEYFVGGPHLSRAPRQVLHEVAAARQLATAQLRPEAGEGGAEARDGGGEVAQHGAQPRRGGVVADTGPRQPPPVSDLQHGQPSSDTEERSGH